LTCIKASASIQAYEARRAMANECSPGVMCALEADMSLMTVLVLLALAATIFSLIRGISTMAVDKPVGERSGVHWMFARVGFQALTVVLLLAALVIGR
jgi:hypothetical protein